MYLQESGVDTDEMGQSLPLDFDSCSPLFRVANMLITCSVNLENSYNLYQKPESEFLGFHLLSLPNEHLKRFHMDFHFFSL